MQFESGGLHHTLSTTMVFQSDDYSRFRMINGNRQLNELKIKRIIAEIESGNDMLAYYPIQCNEGNGLLEIADGQHRFYISRKLRKPVHYIIIKKKIELYDIAKVNSLTEKWSGKDFINCYVQAGNENYIKLQQVMDTYPVPLTTAISMLQSGKVNDGGGTKEKFERGEFESSHFDSAMQIFELCNRFNYNRKFQRYFISAITRIVAAGKIDNMEEFIFKINDNATEIISNGDWKEYLVNLENIYNKRNRIRATIY